MTRSTFCYWHAKTVENPTDCAAHTCEGRVFGCPYITPGQAEKRCPDYERCH